TSIDRAGFAAHGRFPDAGLPATDSDLRKQDEQAAPLALIDHAAAVDAVAVEQDAVAEVRGRAEVALAKPLGFRGIVDDVGTELGLLAQEGGQRHEQPARLHLAAGVTAEVVG